MLYVGHLGAAGFWLDFHGTLRRCKSCRGRYVFETLVNFLSDGFRICSTVVRAFSGL